MKSINSYNMGEGRTIRVWFVPSCIPRPCLVLDKTKQMLFSPWVITVYKMDSKRNRKIGYKAIHLCFYLALISFLTFKSFDLCGIVWQMV